MRATLPSLLVVACLACGPAPRPHPESPAPASVPTSAPASQRGPTGVITRVDLRAFLNRGMQPLIANVVLDRYPRLTSKRFRGWRVIEFFPADARFRDVDLKPGDVVVRVNGRSIERPEQWDAVWTGLKTAKELVVETQRKGQERTLRWRIE